MTVVGVGVALVETVAVGNGDSDGGPSRVCIDGRREHTRGRVCVEADGGIYLAIEAERRRGAAADAQVSVRLPDATATEVAAELRDATTTNACEAASGDNASVVACGNDTIDGETPAGRVVIDGNRDVPGVEVSVVTRFTPGDCRGRGRVHLSSDPAERVADALDSVGRGGGV